MDDDILILNGAIPSWAAGGPPDADPPGVAASCFVRIKTGIIKEIGKMTDLPVPPAARHIIDATDTLLIPGLINMHNHAAMILFRGLFGDLPLKTWLNDHIFPAEAKYVNPEMVYWCGKLAAAEMILAGTTMVADGYYYEAAAAAAFRDAGLRAVVAHGIIDFPAPGVPDPAENINVVDRFIEQWDHKSDLITPAVFCHSPYTCSPDTLQKAKQLARRHKAPYFIHVAETRDEIKQVRERYKTTPVGLLDSLGVLDKDSVCVHCVWVDDQDLDILARSGAGIVTCPTSNMKLAAGVAPVAKMLARGIPVGLGTDSAACNNALDLFAEMNICGLAQHVGNPAPPALAADRILTMATGGGAGTFGFTGRLGRLAAGQCADISIIALKQPHLLPACNDDVLVYAAGGADVATVIINGRLVMRDRRLLSIDLEETVARVRSMVDR